jgi:hypothetical protein
MSHKDDLIAVMREARADLERAVAAYDGRLDTALDDGWTVRDAVAHIAVWERMAARKIAGTPLPLGEEIAARKPWNLDSFNDAMRELLGSLSDGEILSEFAGAYQSLLAAVEAASDADCAPKRTGWQAIDEDGAGHYHLHFPVRDVMAERWAAETGTR